MHRKHSATPRKPPPPIAKLADLPWWVRLCCRLGLHLSRHAGAMAYRDDLPGAPTRLEPGWVCDACGDFHSAVRSRPLSWCHAPEVAPLWGGRSPALEQGLQRIGDIEGYERSRLPHDVRRRLRGQGLGKIAGIRKPVTRAAKAL
jgi:hypothetical protein